jgi:hypothetical protein
LQALCEKSTLEVSPLATARGCYRGDAADCTPHGVVTTRHFAVISGRL